MEKIKIHQFEMDRVNIAVVPKAIISNYVIKRSLSCLACFVLAILMVIPVTVMPGLVFFVAPAEIAILGKIHDEAQLIQWVRRHTIVREGRWEDTESCPRLLRYHQLPALLPVPGP